MRVFVTGGTGLIGSAVLAELLGNGHTVGRRLGLPVASVPAETYGPLGQIFATDQPSSSTHTQQSLGWKPTHLSLPQDLENIQP